MTDEQFRDAVEQDRPVRLKDRTRCFYDDEWYEPYLDDAGDRMIRCHTGEHKTVDDELLAQLTTEVDPMTVERIPEVAGRAADLPVVIEDPQTGKLTPLDWYQAHAVRLAPPDAGAPLRRATFGEASFPALVLGGRPDGPTVD